MKIVLCWFFLMCAAIIFGCSPSRYAYQSKAYFMVSSPGINSETSSIDIDSEKSAVIQKPNAKFDTVYKIYMEIPAEDQVRIDSVQIAEKVFLASLQELLPEQNMIGSNKQGRDPVKLNHSPGKTWWKLQLRFARTSPINKAAGLNAIIYGMYRGRAFNTIRELEELAPEFRM